GLVGPHPVLARDGAAGVDAGQQDRLGQLSRPLGLPLPALVVENERVQVAVAGMEDVADAQAVLALQPRHLPEPARALRAGAAAIVRRPGAATWAGRWPAATMPDTGPRAVSVEPKPASNVTIASGCRSTRSVTSVAMPSVPSEPTKTPSKPGPAWPASRRAVS